MVSSTPPNEPTSSSAERPVLIWSPDSDASRVAATVEQAAESLNVTPADVLAAIASGDLLEGWFVDWEASDSSST